MKTIILIIALLALASAWNQPGRPAPYPPQYPGQPGTGFPQYPQPPQPGYPGYPQPGYGGFRPQWANGYADGLPKDFKPQPRTNHGYIPNAIDEPVRRFKALIAFEAFSTKLGFTQEHKSALQSCAAELRTAALPLVAGGKAAAQAKLLGFLFASDAEHREVIATLLEKAQTSFPECRQFVLSLGSVFSKATLSQDEQYVAAYRSLTKYRLQKYAAEIISTLVTVVEDKHAGRSRQVGENLATIVQLITGLEHPQTVMDYIMKYEENHKEYIEISVLETDRFIQSTLNVIAKELGSTDQITEERVKEIREAVVALLHNYVQNKIKLHSAQNVIEREVIALGAVRDLVKEGAVVLGSVHHVAAQVFGPAFEGLARRGPKAAAITVLKNYYKNLPTIQRRAIDIGLETRHHHPAATGKAIAGLVKTLIQH